MKPSERPTPKQTPLGPNKLRGSRLPPPVELPPKRGVVSLADAIKASERATLSQGGSSKVHFLGPKGTEQARKTVRGE
jgi:hypothetical protein